MIKSNPNSPTTTCRRPLGVRTLHKYALPKEDYAEHNGRVRFKNHQQTDDDNVLAKAAAFVYVLFQIFYFYFVDIVKRTIYLTNVQQSEEEEEEEDDDDDDDVGDKKWQTERRIEAPRQFASKDVLLDTVVIPRSDVQLTTPFVAKPKAIQKPIETNYITTVFEVQNHGLKMLIDDISEEIRRWRSNGEYIACCEVVWSVPTKYRNYPAEIRLKNEIFDCLRSNNQRIFDSENLSTDNTTRCPVAKGVTEETAGRRDGCYLGIYRKYHQDLLDLVHQETQPAHETVWKFDSKALEPKFDWPVIGPLENTAVVMLHVICVKF